MKASAPEVTRCYCVDDESIIVSALWPDWTVCSIKITQADLQASPTTGFGGILADRFRDALRDGTARGERLWDSLSAVLVGQ